MKLGARILKTGIAIILSLYLGQLLHSPSPVFAGISAIFAIQPTIYRSYLTIIEQIQGNIIGALLAVFFVLTLGNHFTVIGLAAIIAISINLKLKLENTIGLSLVTLVSIMETTGGNFIPFAAIRFSTIMIGVFSAFIVNLVFMPPKYESKLYFKISSTTEELIRWIRLSTRHDFEHHLLKEEIEKLKDSLIKMEQFYGMYKEEHNYFKKKNLEKSRKLVVYRQMIFTAKKGVDTLRKLHRFENEILLLPEHFQQAIQEQLDNLIYHHEQLMLRFIGKVPEPATESGGNDFLNKKELYDLFITHQKEYTDPDNPHLYHIMQITAFIIDYGEQLEHLDTLISSFYSYHDNEVPIEEKSHE
ncbi:aromatic acid exporter family protein [Bacillus salipaludis]|uniref:Aromatic acid exporter family protein n=1 Tax=Bacillus salipaludis TaxID=2547811 RepID=A0A4R5VNG6_9BACI|nr:aromatic acid exporter family protein [Bacillus salipaludis]MDQ6596226.1 aromatic acid exporter family protein [Bacillus salipaludis]TDK59015.1 aromatic acid exporter family protein [Bacillus salipaludis]